MRDLPNLSYIKKLSGDDDAFEQRFIGILKDEFPEEMDAYVNHIEKQVDFNAAAEMVHKLKHKFNILSMEHAYGLAVCYEEDLLAGTSESHHRFMKTLEQVKNYLKTI